MINIDKEFNYDKPGHRFSPRQVYSLQTITIKRHIDLMFHQ